MSNAFETYRSDQVGAEDYMREQPKGGGRIQLIFALAGMVSLGYMLWTIAKLLA